MYHQKILGYDLRQWAGVVLVTGLAVGATYLALNGDSMNTFAGNFSESLGKETKKSASLDSLLNP